MRQLAESYPVQVICRVWEIPRSTYYYRSQAADEHELPTNCATRVLKRLIPNHMNESCAEREIWGVGVAETAGWRAKKGEEERNGGTAGGKRPGGSAQRGMPITTVVTE